MTEASIEAKVSQRVAIDWFNFFRDICAEYFLAHPITIGKSHSVCMYNYFITSPITIGGPGKIVEIDESKFGTIVGGSRMATGCLVV